MKRANQRIYFAFAVAIVFVLLCGNAWADEWTLGLSHANGTVGGDVSVPVVLDEPGFNGVAFTVAYNATALAFQGLGKGEEGDFDVAKLGGSGQIPDFSSSTIYYAANDNADQGQVSIAAASANMFEDIQTSNATLFELNFKIKDNLDFEGSVSLGLNATTIQRYVEAGYMDEQTVIPVLTRLESGSTDPENELGLEDPLTMIPGSIDISPAPVNNIPHDPTPADEANNVNATQTVLQWGVGETVSYDVYFGLSTPLVDDDLVKAGLETTSFDLVSNATFVTNGTLLYDQTYFWKIVAKDAQNATYEGPVWQFTTEDPVQELTISAEDSNLEVGETTRIMVTNTDGPDDAPELVAEPEYGYLSNFTYDSEEEVFKATYSSQSKGSESLQVETPAKGQSNSLTLDIFERVTITFGDEDEDGVARLGESVSLSVSGGNPGNQSWIVFGPQDEDVTEDVLTTKGDGIVFSPLESDNYAGAYEILLNDDTSGISGASQTIYVPLGDISKSQTNVLESSKDGIEFTVQGAAQGISWSTVDLSGDELDGIGSFGNSTNGSVIFMPGSVAGIVKFNVQASMDAEGKTASVSDLVRIIPSDTYTVQLMDGQGVSIDGNDLSSGDVVVSVQEQTKRLMTENGQVEFEMPDLGGTYEYRVQDTRINPEFVSQTVRTGDKDVDIVLERVGPDSLSGRVMSGAEPVEDATVSAYQPSSIDQVYSASTNSTGDFSIALPLGAFGGGWTVVATKNGYVSSVLTGQSPGIEIRFEYDDCIKEKTEIEVVTASHFSTATEWGWLIVQADPPITSRNQVTVSNIGNDSWTRTGDIELTNDNILYMRYEGNAPFSVLVKVDTTEGDGPEDGYAASAVYEYINDEESVTLEPIEMDTGGGGHEVSVEGQTAKMEIPVGGLKNRATFSFVPRAKQRNDSEIKGSPGYIYEIKAFDSQGRELSDSQIERLNITLPIDLTIVEPGDIEDETYGIFYAKDTSDLISGEAERVAQEDILATDYLGENDVGSVTFKVGHLTSFGVGTESTEDANGTDPGNGDGDDGDGGGGGGGGGCTFSLQSQGSAGCWLVLLMIVSGLRLWAGKSRRNPNRPA